MSLTASSLLTLGIAQASAWLSARLLAAVDKNAEKWAYVLQADLYNKLSSAKELTFGPPLSRLGKAHASMALRSLLHRLQREVGELRTEVASLRDAIQRVGDCPHRAECPVLDSLQRKSQSTEV